MDRRKVVHGPLRKALDRYEGQLVDYAARFTGDVDAAREIVFEVYLRLRDKDPRTVANREGEYLFTVCRKLARVAPRAETKAEPPPAGNKDDARLRLQLGKLPPEQEEVLRLRLQARLSIAEIGRVIGATEEDVGNLLYEALTTLRRRLDEDGPEIVRIGGSR